MRLAAGLVSQAGTTEENTIAVNSNKSSTAGVCKVRQRQPLKDRSNTLLLNKSFKSASAALEGPSPVEPCETEDEQEELLLTQAQHESVQLDSDGFVVWEDDEVEDCQATVTVESLKAEAKALRDALSAALEENRHLHAKVAVLEAGQDELVEVQAELESVYTLYAMAKEELDAYRK